MRPINKLGSKSDLVISCEVEMRGGKKSMFEQLTRPRGMNASYGFADVCVRRSVLLHRADV